MIGAILGWIVFGLIVGALARLLLPGRDPMGFLGTIAVGIGGSFIGGLLASLLFGGDLDWENPAGWIGSIIGAILLLLLVRRFAGPAKP